MRVGVDASNIRAGGGGVAHLRELLAAATPSAFGIDEVLVWSGAETLAALPERPWLHAIHEPALDRGLLQRTAWRFTSLDRHLRESGADVLFVPGGIYMGRFRPFVAMSQNMLAFQDGERQRYGWSLARLRVELIRRAQIRTFSIADGLVFPTATGRRFALETVTPRTEVIATIPPGVGKRFRLAPRRQRPIEEHSPTRPFTWLYVSRIEPYKHQWNVVTAVGMLRREGLPVELELVGTGTGRPRRRLEEAIATWDPHGEYIKNLGMVEDTAPRYRLADGAIFASSCETPGFTLLESMAAGLPIACSNRSAMPELLGDAGEYFDPEDAGSIAAALRRMLASPARRFEIASRAFEQSQNYAWSRCAADTLQLVARVAASHRT